VTKVISLDVFSEKEAEFFLDNYEIRDGKRRAEILRWSERLPVLMNWLATPQAKESVSLLPLHDIVERFLRWVKEPTWREIATLVAFPRIFNLDILHVLLPQEKFSTDEQVALNWLQTMPFVQSRTGGWQYHPVVRRMMLSYQRQVSPQRYAQKQAILASWYQALCQNQQEDLELANELWRRNTLEYIYHNLAADPLAQWQTSVEWFVIAMRRYKTFAGEIIELLHSDDLRDELHSEQYQVVKLLYEQFRILKEGDVQNSLAMFEYISTIESLSIATKGYIFAFKGESYRAMRRYEEALADFDRAIALNEQSAWIFAGRGQIYWLMRRYEEALADFDQALSLGGKSAWIFAERGQTYRLMGRYEQALADFDQALSLDKNSSWIIARRGESYLGMGRYEEALADFDQAITLDEKLIWVIGSRGETYRLIKRYEEALADFDRAITLDEKYSWAIGSRGETYRAMRRYEEALADFDRAIALNEQSAWIFAGLGETYRLMGRYEEALANFDQAITLDEDYSWAIGSRGQTYWLMGRYEEALTDFDRAIALDEQSAWIFAGRGQTYLLMGRYEEALTNFDQAIILDEQSAWIFVGRRGETYRAMGRYEEALADFDRAIALDEKSGWQRYDRAQVHYLLHDESAFQQDMAVAIDLEKQARASSNNVLDSWRRDFNLAVFTLFLGSDPEIQHSYERLIADCLFLSSLQDALEDLEDLLTIQPKNVLIPTLQQQLRAKIQALEQTKK
jgi:tetratricopeptide (TPR) repeat protein